MRCWVYMIRRRGGRGGWEGRVGGEGRGGREGGGRGGGGGVARIKLRFTLFKFGKILPDGTVPVHHRILLNVNISRMCSFAFA